MHTVARTRADRARMEPALHERAAFEVTVAAVIAANTATAIYSMAGGEGVWPEHFETACLVFFCLELLLRIRHHGTAFFRSPWSWIDLAIITVSLLPILGASVSVLRVGKIARLFHLGRHIVGSPMSRLMAH